MCRMFIFQFHGSILGNKNGILKTLYMKNTVMGKFSVQERDFEKFKYF